MEGPVIVLTSASCGYPGQLLWCVRFVPGPRSLCRSGISQLTTLGAHASVSPMCRDPHYGTRLLSGPAFAADPRASSDPTCSFGTREVQQSSTAQNTVDRSYQCLIQSRRSVNICEMNPGWNKFTVLSYKGQHLIEEMSGSGSVVWFQDQFRGRRKKPVCDHANNSMRAATLCVHGGKVVYTHWGWGKDVWEKGQHPLQSEGLRHFPVQEGPMVLSNWLSSYSLP